jgi:integrase
MFPEAKPEEYAFPACENARLDCEKPDTNNIEASRPIKSWRTAWRRALKDAGLKIRFHDLRHTCITKLAEGHASEQTLMSISGHLSRKMLKYYSHIRMAAKPRPDSALDARLCSTKYGDSAFHVPSGDQLLRDRPICTARRAETRSLVGEVL